MKGWKVWTGTVGYVLCEGLLQVYPEYEALCRSLQSIIFIPLGVIGIAHKIEKAKRND